MEPEPAAAGREDPSLAPGSDLATGLREAAARLAAAGVVSARADAELLAAHLLSRRSGEEMGRGEVVARAIAGSATVPEGFAELVSQREARVPLQHLTGRAPFRHLVLEVGPGVFVPRPETEVLIDELNAFLRAPEGRPADGRSPLVVDLATGSGALALAAAQENPGARVVGVELSALALAWAQRNATMVRETHGATVQILRGDAVHALPGAEGTVDAVVTNPPYVPQDAVPQDPEVALHDPDLALYGGSADGLAVPEAFLARAAVLLRPGGLLIMEHAEVQASAVAQLFRAHGLDRVRTVQDLTGRDRATLGYAVAEPDRGSIPETKAP